MAEFYWEKNDYAKVVFLLERYLDQLSAEERSRYDYALAKVKAPKLWRGRSSAHIVEKDGNGRPV